MTDLAPDITDEEHLDEELAAQSAGPDGAGPDAPDDAAALANGEQVRVVPADGGAVEAQAALAQVKGRIEIEDEVVEKVAALSAIEVEGVSDLGGDIERAVESVRERIGVGHKRGDQGVTAEIRGREVSITLQVVIEYGHVVMEVARAVKTNVARSTNRMLGLRVVEVNVVVDDVVMPDGFNHGSAQQEREAARHQAREQRKQERAQADEDRYLSID